MVHKEKLRAIAIPKNAFLEKVNNQEKQNKLTFNITYHAVFWNVIKVLEKLHAIFVSDNGYKKIFPDVHLTVLKNN